jgi:uncharacterized protein YheU (UPF0270 family)
MIEVPISHLSAEAQIGVIDDFILREGTDYGSVEMTHETKVSQIRKQIEHGDVKIVFDEETETVTLMTANEFKKAGQPC